MNKTFVLIEVDHSELQDVNVFTQHILDSIDFQNVPVEVRSITLAPTHEGVSA